MRKNASFSTVVSSALLPNGILIPRASVDVSLKGQYVDSRFNITRQIIV